MYSNPRYANEEDQGILLEQADGVDLYVDTGELYDQAVAGDFGPVLPFEPPAPPTVEELRHTMPTLTPRQLRLMLLQIDMSEDDVRAKIDAIEDPVAKQAATIEWEWATSYRRLHPLVQSIATDLGFPDEQLDDLWMYASTI